MTPRIYLIIANSSIVKRPFIWRLVSFLAILERPSSGIYKERGDGHSIEREKRFVFQVPEVPDNRYNYNESPNQEYCDQTKPNRFIANSKTFPCISMKIKLTRESERHRKLYNVCIELWTLYKALLKNTVTCLPKFSTVKDLRAYYTVIMQKNSKIR